MKIRTKLLLVLGAISLLTPVAAYVALTANPRIAFALRMNEYQTRQEIMAQQLKSDLGAIDSALEESTAASYRGQAQAGKRKEAERQRNLANSALRSSVAAYEADLHAIARSEMQQAHDIRAGGRPTSADSVEQKETQALKDLEGSSPGLQAGIAQFLELSGSGSAAEGDFVQNTLEPQLRENLFRTAQELTFETGRAGQEYRKDIDMSLADSYKETLWIVMLGLATGGGLTLIVSRAILTPIRKLRDAAQQFGRGNMDMRISRHSRDELGEVAESFNSMADNLTRLIGERQQAQEEMASANRKLHISMTELESRNREAVTLSEMGDLLQSCFTIAEASRVIGASARHLFLGFSGALLVFSSSRNVLEVAATWGSNPLTEGVFEPNDCWALRRGRLHLSPGEQGGVRCAHFGAESRLPGLCKPLMAHGETLGVLSLVADGNGAAGSADSISGFNEALARAVAEQAGLAFANLRLREKLSYQSVRDPLTGLFNRRYLEETLERELPRAIRKNRGLGVAMMDVDQFKKFNDIFGHDAGDTVLRELGDYLAKFIRHGDIACRYGGEEFLLVLPESSLEETRQRAEELRATFQQFTIKHRDTVLGKVTLSLGAAAFPEHGMTAHELLAAADAALLQAKADGRDRVLVAPVFSGHAD